MASDRTCEDAMHTSLPDTILALRFQCGKLRPDAFPDSGLCYD